MAKFTRRHILATGTALGTVLGTSACIPRPDDPLPPLDLESDEVRVKRAIYFKHGVASGDPKTDGMIIWTRVQCEAFPRPDSVGVNWSVATDSEFTNIVAIGRASTSAERDYTVKVDVSGLEPDMACFYKFTIEGVSSQIGRFKTLPAGPIERARFAIVSCANFQAGYFNAYDQIARLNAVAGDGFDAVIHLGDYFYEYGVEGWGGSFEDRSRLHKPAHEIVSLADYRMRHAQYRTDVSLQAMTQGCPMICLWDDHESANDSYEGGAQNHQSETEGDWAVRKAAALKAYYEWMPIREPAKGRELSERYDVYSYGDLLSLVSIETRLSGRSEPIDMDEYTPHFKNEADVKAFKQGILRDPNRTMMDEPQLDFVTKALQRSKEAGQPWRLLANQVILGRLETPDLTPHVDETAVLAIETDWPAVRSFIENSKYSLPVYPDSWDGYPLARENFYDRLIAAGVNDVLVVTGDAHEFWLNDLTNEAGTKLGLEIGVTSVTSPTLQSYFGEATAPYSLLMTQSNDDARYYNALHNGFVHLTLTRDSGVVTMVGIDTIVSREYSAFDVASFSIKPDGKSLKAISPKGLNLKQRALFSGLG